MSEKVTPSAQLAVLVVDRLIRSGLIRPEKRGALLTKIEAGTMRETDWKHEIDLASTKG